MRAAAGSVRTAILAWLGAFVPAPLAIDGRERARAVLGVLLGLLFTAVVSRWLADRSADGTWLLAPLGASAVLIFVTPASPLAQPWAVLGGNVISAAIGIACSIGIANAVIAAPVAVALAIAVMLALRCLHPPGGAMALLAVLMHAGHNELALGAALSGSLLLIVAGAVYNPLTGRRYPHAQRVAATPDNRARFAAEDLDAVLSRYNQVLDVSRDELAGLLDAAEAQAYRRRLGELHCSDIMSAAVVTVEFGTPLQQAWDLMQSRRIKALPVVDRARRIVGIVTLNDFLRAAGVGGHDGVRARLRALLTPSGRSHSDKPEVVGQVMHRPVRAVTQDAPAAELMAVFDQTGHHHLPIVDAQRRIAGMATQADVLRALRRVA